MLINEITRGRYIYPKPKKATRIPYAKAPKPLPKPKQPTPTPLQLKNRRKKIQQSYTNMFTNALDKRLPPTSQKMIKPTPPESALSNDQQRSKDEMETFIKIVRGELPR